MLTRIPWLRNASDSASDRVGDLRTESTSLIDGPNGAGSLETVTVSMNGIARTGVVPPGSVLLSQPDTDLSTVGRQTRSSSAAAAVARKEEAEEDGEGEERIHARGPEEIGVEDMGPQSAASEGAIVFDIEGALGRRGEGEKILTADKEGDQDGDGDIVIADADGKVEGEEGAADRSGENAGPDAVDSTAL